MRQSVSFYSGDHLLAGDLYLPEGLVSGEARPGIVLCNGYTATKDLYLPETAAVLNHAGCVVLSFDYTGWGESEGSRHRLALAWQFGLQTLSAAYRPKRANGASVVCARS